MVNITDFTPSPLEPNIESEVTFTYNDIEYTESVTLETTYELAITNKEALLEQEIVADGSDVYKVEVALMTPNLEVATDVTGLAEFVSKKGLTAQQEEKALDKGVATFYVTTENSVTDVTDAIKVVLKDCSNDELIGLESKSITLTYSGKDVSGEGVTTEQTVYPVSKIQSTDLADRIYVYVPEVDIEHESKVEAAILDQVKIYNNAGTLINLIKIVNKEIVATKGNDKESLAYTVLLDVKDGVLTDNQNNDYEVVGPSSKDVKVKLSEVTDLKEFMVIDANRPYVAQVKVSDNDEKFLGINTLLVVFNEPVSTSAEIEGNWILNGTRLTSDKVKNIRVLDIPEVASKDSELADYLAYNAVEEGKERNSVIIELTTSTARQLLLDGENLIQAKSISDWAGLSDLSDNNIITTQDFTFNYAKPASNPGITLEMESPEQFVITMNEPLYTDVNATTEIDLTKSDIIVELAAETITDADYKIVSLENDKYILELTKDWTKILTGAKTYHNKTFKVIIKEAYDVYGEHYFLDDKGTTDDDTDDVDNRISDSVVIPEDTTSPAVEEIVKYIGATEGTTTYVKTPGHMQIMMTEPVQLLARAGEDVSVENLVNPEVTPSVQQEAGEGVPVPTFEYVKLSYVDGDIYAVGDKVDGEIFDTPIDEHDNQFTVKPTADTLENGNWKLVVRSISDDIGNTMRTEEFKFTVNVAGATPVDPTKDNTVDPYVIWAYVDDDKTVGEEVYGDYVYILYSRTMSTDVLRSATYDINGKQVGQDADITAENVVLYRQNSDLTIAPEDVKYYDANNMPLWRGQLITIKLPKDFIIGGDDLDGGTKHNVLTIPRTLTARDDGVDATGEKLLFDNNDGSNQFELTFDKGYGTTGIDLNGFVPTIEKNNENYETVEKHHGI